MNQENKTYYIYHIPGIKIGCTFRGAKKRAKEQGYTDYEVLEIHTDKYTASKREQELQVQYGYKKDNIKYHVGKYSVAGKKGAETNNMNGWNKIWQKLGNKTSTKKLKKIILQYDLDGNFIKEWKCGVNELNRKYGYDVAAVCQQRKNHKTIGGYQWRYKESNDYPKKIEPFNNKSFQKVVQKDLQGNTIKIWDNQTQAAKSVGCTVQMINRVCNGKGKTAKGYKWERI